MAALQAAKKYATLPPTVRTLASGVPNAPSLNLSARTSDAHHHDHAGRSDLPSKWAGGYQLSSNGLTNKSFSTVPNASSVFQQRTMHMSAPRQRPRRVRSARPKRIPSVLTLSKPCALLLRNRIHGRSLRVRSQILRGRVPRHDVRLGGRARARQGRGGTGEHSGGQERDHQVARQTRLHSPSYAGRDR